MAGDAQLFDIKGMKIMFHNLTFVKICNKKYQLFRGHMFMNVAHATKKKKRVTMVQL